MLLPTAFMVDVADVVAVWAAAGTAPAAAQHAPMQLVPRQPTAAAYSNLALLTAAGGADNPSCTAVL